METGSSSIQIGAIIKRYLKWYSYPLIYFLVASLPCAYALYTKPIPYGAFIKAVFNSIVLIPTLILMGATTAWIIIAMLLFPMLSWLGKRFPRLYLSVKSAGLLQKETLNREPPSNNQLKSFWWKTVDISISATGVILVIASITAALWYARPYITFLLSTAKIGELEKRASLIERVRSDTMRWSMENQDRSDALQKGLEERAGSGQVQEDWIIIPTALVDSPILEGISLENLALGVCRVSESAVPGEGGNCIIEGHNLGSFGWWKPQGPFNMLKVMEEGVNIYVYYKGKKYRYQVKEKRYKDANDPKLYDFTPGERLTLITCTSSWDPAIYTNKRTVIVAYPQGM